MEVGIQGPRIILPAYSRMRDGFEDPGTGLGVHPSLSQSFRDVLHPWEGGACPSQGFRVTFV